jgi:hypothetical protein
MVRTPKAQADRAAHFPNETFILFNRFISRTSFGNNPHAELALSA